MGPHYRPNNLTWRFIILLGVVSLFSDMTYEGGRSISGPFLGSLQASAFIVASLSGFGEFLGYSLRLLSGYLTDRLGKYYLLTFVGYSMNMLAVPMLAPGGTMGTRRHPSYTGACREGHPYPVPRGHALPCLRPSGARSGVWLS